ncbi:hypothetical protein ACGFYE_22940 [Streptomyces zaomyceticus]|uniref:hypothetical protein n=1 Tax=Streptomyces zaomyceticus TaxID=68286 RepID=UPI0037214EA5
MDVVFAEHLDNERRMLAGLSPSERRQPARLLRKLEVSIVSSDEESADTSAQRGDAESPHLRCRS